MILNQRLIKTLGLSWLAFLLMGLLIRIAFTLPSITLLIDHSYCPAHQWQQIVQIYSDLYHQNQHRKLRLQTVILFNHLGQEILPSPPSPEIIQNLSTYGHADRQRQIHLQKTYPQAQLLSCDIDTEGRR